MNDYVTYFQVLPALQWLHALRIINVAISDHFERANPFRF